MASVTAIPDFRRQLLFPEGHSQTLAGVWLSRQLPPDLATRREVHLPDGDRLVLHEDTPPGWQPGDPVALLVHGLAGSHRSPYMRRIATKLTAVGVRSYRLDLRTCGAGLTLAHRPYNSGRSADVREAIREVVRHSPGSPVGLLGFSMGANIALKLAGEDPRANPPELVSVFAVCPPVDLQRCVRHLQATWLGRMYDRYFAKLLWNHVQRWQSATPTAPRFDFPHRPRSIEEFDDLFTGPIWGYGSSAPYYAEASAWQYVPTIAVPTLIVASQDDPMVAPEPLRDLQRPESVQLFLTRGGGHLGFRSRNRHDPDRHWLDWRAVDWIRQTVH